MSVATELPPTVFIPVRARRQAPAATPARPRLRLVPPGDGCVPVSGTRASGARRGRQARLVSLAAVPATAAAVGVGRGQFGTRPLRLTRRGVIAIALGVAAVGGLLLLVAHLSAGPSAARSAITPGTVVTVQPGDTLWSIAGAVAPGRDPRRVIERIRQSNHLTSVSLTPGQTLKVG